MSGIIINNIDKMVNNNVKHNVQQRRQNQVMEIAFYIMMRSDNQDISCFLTFDMFLIFLYEFGFNKFLYDIFAYIFRK